LKPVRSHQDKEYRPSTVLVVEDDIVIRSPLVEYLRSAGYSVVEATNAEEAVALFRAGVSIDVVFSDIRMPGSMDGLGLAHWIRRHQPGVRVALTSGADNAARAAKVSESYVPKPYQFATAARHIARLVGEPALPKRIDAPNNPPQSPIDRPRSLRRSATRPSNGPKRRA
jgi:CheY-like chemotaxis protein